MGVHFLMSILEKSGVMEDVDLVQIAKNFSAGERMKILIDFYSWEYFMKENFWASLALLTGNEYLRFAGGEYDLIDKFTRSVIDALRQMNIELEFFLDGAKGSSYNATRQKMKTWEQRHQADQQSLARCFEFLHGQLPLSDVDCRDVPRPVLQEIQNIDTIQSLGCKIHQMVSGEADTVIAQSLRDDKNAYCVFSNDSDFCIFPGSILLFHSSFDMGNHLNLGGNSLVATKPEKLMCKIIRSETIIKRFGLKDEDALIELATMAGNDFTSPLLKQVPEYRKSYVRQLDKIAHMINEFGCLENCPFYGELMRRNSQFQESVRHSRLFYHLCLPDEEAGQGGFLYHTLAEGIKQGKYPSTLMAMTRGFYWHRLVLENPSPGNLTADGVLAPLRAYVYTMILPFQTPGITEYGRSPLQVLDRLQVPKAIDGRAPTLTQVKKNSFSRNMAAFEGIITHQDYGDFFNGKSVFKLFGIRMGFLVYLLRYFLILNWGKNLFISEREFYVMVAWVLAKHDGEAYRRLTIVPSPRCITVQTWFLTLYRVAYAFLGNLLGLSHEFPLPKDVFSGAVWVALYTSWAVSDPNPNFREPHPLSVNPDDLNGPKQKVWKVIKDHRHIVQHLTEGFFPCHV